MPMVLGGSQGGGRFLMGEVPLEFWVRVYRDKERARDPFTTSTAVSFLGVGVQGVRIRTTTNGPGPYTREKLGKEDHHNP